MLRPCTTQALCIEAALSFDCSYPYGLQQHAQVHDEAHGAMRSLMGQKDQKSVSGFHSQCENNADQCTVSLTAPGIGMSMPVQGPPADDFL